jgi:hypothetical protein
VAAVLHVHVELLEGVLIHQQLDALARGQLAAFVLGIDARLPAAEPGLRPPPLQLFQHFLHVSRPDSIAPLLRERHSTKPAAMVSAGGLRPPSREVSRRP